MAPAIPASTPLSHWRATAKDGAFGVANALIYPPDAYADTDELVAVCRAMAPLGGLYITHLRSEANELLEGVEEALTIGQRAGVPVEIYHLKASGRANWAKLPQLVARIEAARAAGQDVTADINPYTVAGTGLDSIFPPWLAADGRLFDNLRDETLRARARAEVLNPGGGWEPVGALAGPEGITPLSSPSSLRPAPLSPPSPAPAVGWPSASRRRSGWVPSPTSPRAAGVGTRPRRTTRPRSTKKRKLRSWCRPTALVDS